MEPMSIRLPPSSQHLVYNHLPVNLDLVQPMRRSIQPRSARRPGAGKRTAKPDRSLGALDRLLGPRNQLPDPVRAVEMSGFDSEAGSGGCRAVLPGCSDSDGGNFS